MRALIPIVLLAALVLPACQKASRRTISAPPSPPAAMNSMEPGKFLTAAGTWQHADEDGRSSLNISIRRGELRWMVDYRPTKGVRSTPNNKLTIHAPSDPWFVFMEAPGSFWFFNGRDYLYHSLSDGGGERGEASLNQGQLQPEAALPPAAVIQRLPAELQKLYPKVEPPRKRPSI